jgi:hypothetical protein
MLKVILSALTAILFGFGFWYLIFWFVTTEPNLFLWHWGTKTVYLLFAFASASGISEALIKE